MIENTGNITINELAEKTGYTQRYVNRIFTECYGMSPKVFSKLMRFQYLLDNLNLGLEQVDFTRMAQDMGDYDQSHMMKEFKAFTETTPKRYLLDLKQTEYDKRLIIITKK